VKGGIPSLFAILLGSSPSSFFSIHLASSGFVPPSDFGRMMDLSYLDRPFPFFFLRLRAIAALAEASSL